MVTNVPTKKDGTITPLQQFNAGVDAKNVKCPLAYQKVIIRADGIPYCVTEHIFNVLSKIWSSHLRWGYINYGCINC